MQITLGHLYSAAALMFVLKSSRNLGCRDLSLRPFLMDPAPGTIVATRPYCLSTGHSAGPIRSRPTQSHLDQQLGGLLPVQLGFDSDTRCRSTA